MIFDYNPSHGENIPIQTSSQPSQTIIESNENTTIDDMENISIETTTQSDDSDDESITIIDVDVSKQKVLIDIMRNTQEDSKHEDDMTSEETIDKESSLNIIE